VRPRSPRNDDGSARRRRHRVRRHGLGRHDHAAALTLESVRNGRTVRIVRVTGGRRLVHRLATLGLVPGSVVTVVRNRGPAIVSVRGTRMVVGRGAAEAIEWEEVDG
jgi:ferrous iron transport protein A